MAYATTVYRAVSGEGTKTVSVRYYDALDNLLTLSGQVVLDLTAPSVALGGVPESGVSRAPVTVSVSAADALSGVAARYLTLGDGIERAYAAPVTLDTEGIHTVRARATDRAGNSSQTVSRTFTIDQTPPQVTVSGVHDGMVTTETARVTLSAADALTSVSSLEIKVNAEPWKPYTGPVELADIGSHLVWWRASDSAGNSTSGQLTVHRFDTQLTSGMVAAAGARFVNRTSVTVQSEMPWAAEMRFDVSGAEGVWQPYAASTVVALPGEGVHEIVGRYRQGADSGEFTARTSITVDMTRPTISAMQITPSRLSFAGGSARYTLGARWSSQDPGTATSGVAQHLMTAAGVARTGPSAAFVSQPLGAGRHVISAASADHAGNWSSASRMTAELGALAAPRAQRSARGGYEFSVRSAGLSPGASVRFRCFKRHADGSWRLAHTVAATERRPDGTVTGSGVLPPGTWRVALEISTADQYRLGTPCAAMTVR